MSYICGMKERLAEAVYEIVRRIPEGRATSYGAIARAIGYPDSSRLIGKIMGECDSGTTGIPAHRVVNSQGMLSGKDAFETPTKMQEWLEAEGVVVCNGRIRHWERVFWDPMKEITL